MTTGATTTFAFWAMKWKTHQKYSSRAFALNRPGRMFYIVMNLSILGVVPWQEMLQSGYRKQQAIRGFHFHAADLWLLGSKPGEGLVMWTAFASVFSLMLGYSRVPYAAALDGNYFRAFSRVHSEYRFPYVSLLALGGVPFSVAFFRWRT